MCFLIVGAHRKDPKPHIALKSIEVYKVVKDSGRGAYRTLRINDAVEKWEKGYHYTETEFPQPIVYDIDVFGLKYYKIEGDAFHSFVNTKQAENMAYHTGGKVYKMIIPKGAKFFFNRSEGEYVSSDIIYPEDSKPIL